MLLSHISARAIDAVCLLTVDPLDLKAIMEIVSDAASSACTTASFVIRARMNEAASFSVLKNAGSKTITTTLHSAFWFRAKPTITAVSFRIRRRSVAAEKTTIDFGDVVRHQTLVRSLTI